MKNLSKKISYIFHPIFCPLLGVFIILNATSYLAQQPLEKKLIIYGVTIFFTIIIPIATSLILYYIKIIDSIEMKNSKDRLLPFLITAFAYSLNYNYFMFKVQMTQVILVFFIGMTLSVILNMLICIKWKISTHLIGWGGISGLVFSIGYRFMLDLSILLMLVVLLSGLVGYARLKEQAHSVAQVYAGYILGFTCITTLFLTL